MAIKKFEVKLTPQNEEYVNLIPNLTLNLDIILNKMIDAAVEDGTLLSTTTTSLNVNDLSRFKSSYEKLQSKRKSYMDALEVTLPYTKRSVADVYEEDVYEVVDEPVERLPKVKEQKLSHGFTETDF